MSKWSGWRTGCDHTSLGNVQIGEQEDVGNMMNIHRKRLPCRFCNRDDTWYKHFWRRKFRAGKLWRIYQTRRNHLYKWDNYLQCQHKWRKMTNILYNQLWVSRYQTWKNKIKSIPVQALPEAKVPEGQVLTHFPFEMKNPAKQPVHWASFIVEATLKLGILHDTQLASTAPQPKES